MAAGRYTLAALGYRKVFEITHDTAYLRKSAVAYMMLGPSGRDAAIAELRQCVQLATTLADAQESETLLRKAEAMSAAPAAPPPAPAPYPAPAAQPGQLAPGQPPPGAAPPPGMRSTTDANVQIDGQGPRGSYVQTQDCAANPALEICQQRTAVDASSGGIHASFHQDSVTAVKTPPSGTVGLTLNGSFVYGTTTKKTNGDFTIVGGGAQLGLRMQVGLNPFPGAEGGVWSGFVLQPTAAFQGMSASTGSSGGGASTSIGMTLLDLGGTAGFELLSFGSLDSTSLKQKGWGVFAGYHAAWAQTNMFVQGQSTSSNDFSQGPVLELLFPDYNAGTAHVQRGYIEFMLLPIKDFLYVTAGFGFQF
jgi:hypothetical protein